MSRFTAFLILLSITGAAWPKSDAPAPDELQEIINRGPAALNPSVGADGRS